MTFHVGQKVVCIDASQSDGREWMADVPKEGAVYTVRGIIAIYDPVLDEAVTALQLEEIANFPAWEGSYAAHRFRPIVEKKTDISFTAGAPKDSEKWDNRRKVSRKLRERA